MKLGTGVTVLRVGVGSLMMAHGAQKLFGWFRGSGPEGTGEGLEQLGIVPGKQNAIAAGTAEAGGGLLLALGLVTPLGAAAITGPTVTAMRTVHIRAGIWNHEGGWEYIGVLLTTLFAIVDGGPGKLSLDNAIFGREQWGEGWAVAALGAGVAGSFAALELSNAQRKRRQEGESDPPLNPVSGADGSPQTAHHTA